MRRALLVLSLLAALLLVPSQAGAVTYGISDQSPSTFTNPLYAGLKLKVARYIAPYDVMSDPTQLSNLTLWLAAAKAAHQKVLLSVEHSRKTPADARIVPSVSAYTAAITAIKAKFNAYIESFSSWNEVDVCQKGGRPEGQPTKICSAQSGPKIVYGYFKAAKKVFTGKKIVGLDLLDGASPNKALTYVRQFKKYSKGSVKIWGLHNYSDSNRFKDHIKRTKAFVALMKPGQIWLTETGGQLALNGHITSAKDAAKADGCVIKIANEYKTIKRAYFYQFNGGNSTFDAGLIDFGATTPAGERPGYAYVAKRKKYNCNK